MPSSGLREQAQPGWRSAADVQRVEAWRAETNVRREGVGSPDPRGRTSEPWSAGKQKNRPPRRSLLAGHGGRSNKIPAIPTLALLVLPSALKA